MSYFQVPNSKIKLDRSDHIWVFRSESWKCCLCGAVSKAPPYYPTPMAWEPKRYEALSEEDRALCPFVPSESTNDFSLEVD